MLGASTVQIFTLVVAGVAAISGIASAIVSSLFGKRSEERAEQRAIDAEERADRRAQEHWRLDQLRSAYDQCNSLTQQAISMLQGFGMDVAASDTEAVAGARKTLHREYVAIETRIAHLGQRMKVTGGDELGAKLEVATNELIQALRPGQTQIANVAATGQDLLDSIEVASTGLEDYQLAAGIALR